LTFLLLKETLDIIQKLLEKCDVTNLEVDEAKIIAHNNPEKPDEWKTEYDIYIKPSVNHWQIQQIDGLLANYDRVEMEVVHEGLRIFEKEA